MPVSKMLSGYDPADTGSFIWPFPPDGGDPKTVLLEEKVIAWLSALTNLSWKDFFMSNTEKREEK